MKSTAENLKEAIAGEHYEHTEMYPGFLVNSEAGENRKATRSFKYAMEVEKIHEELVPESAGYPRQRYNHLWNSTSAQFADTPTWENPLLRAQFVLHRLRNTSRLINNLVTSSVKRTNLTRLVLFLS